LRIILAACVSIPLNHCIPPHNDMGTAAFIYMYDAVS
jgi:hypothetical protein